MRYLLFDLDGTLTDPGLGITNAVAHALACHGIQPASREELYPYIGPPLTAAFQRYHHLTPPQAEQALRDYRAYFSTVGIFENTLYPGMAAFLRQLRREDYCLILATSKPEPFARRILEHFDLQDLFSFVAGNMLDERRPAKEDVIAYVREQYPALDSRNTLMIGDREYDIRGGREHGLPTVGVLYGYGSRQELEQAGATALAEDLPALLAAIHRLLPPV